MTKPKILFWFNGFLLPYCIAYGLSKYGYNLSAIVDVPDRLKQFYRNQKFVDFQDLYLLHDEIENSKGYDLDYDIDYLKYIENYYNISLWKLAINERFFYQFNLRKFSKTEILLTLEHLCKIYEIILDFVKPNFFITQEPPFSYHQIFYQMCIKRGVKPLILKLSRIGYKSLICSDPTKLGFKQGKQITENNILERNKQELEFIHGMQTSKIDILKGLYSFITAKDSRFFAEKHKSKIIINRIKQELNKRKRQSFIDKNLLKIIPKDTKFIYFPLSIEQEKNTLIDAPYYTNQVELVRHVAKSIPIDYQLYVKEHPAQINRFWRNIADYKDIINIPNTSLFHPSVNSKEFYEKCSLVITTNGTAGFESAQYNKRTILFSETDYSFFPNVTIVDTITNLPKLIKESLIIKIDKSELNHCLEKFNSILFDFDFVEFFRKSQKRFFHGSFLENEYISEQEMTNFLNENDEMIDMLAKRHINIIQSSNTQHIVGVNN